MVNLACCVISIYTQLQILIINKGTVAESHSQTLMPPANMTIVTVTLNI